MDLNSPAIVTRDLTKRFGTFCALDHCTLTVEPGTVLGLLGPNGAGKSTLIRLLMGFLKPSTGTATVFGNDVVRDLLKVHSLAAYLPSSPRLFRTMNGRGVLKFFASLRPDADYQRALAVARLLDLDLSRWVAFMSTGMKQKLAIAVALSNRSRLLILDEPTENLDPNIRRVVMELVGEAKREGKTVLFSSHVLSEVEEVADRVAILRAGKLVHDQGLRDLKGRHQIMATTRQPLVVPANLHEQVTLRTLDAHRVLLDVVGDLAPVLGWLARSELIDVSIAATGLKAVYDLFHGPAEKGSP